ncbi:hypothetical protein FO441_10650 [Salinicoccus cyprini]|uniref:DUF1129 domain-containing protein n=1 Tax=Salinicoccus cyprini TaxID=2493691 RepID=A0A558ARQ9_9STAP|nr:hypothetical protein [Salinicoccus cyprini]TVT26951.1 hypothetical protein FO441_10650 [Salinicoccus cyprini]
MLSRKSEKFLLDLRVELMARGKSSDDIEEMEEELRDHLTEAEAHGKSVDSVTGGSVKSYIRSISEELSLEPGLKQKGTQLIIYLFGLFTIPRLISGQFELSTSMIIYYLLVILFLGYGSLYVMKEMILKFGDSKKTYIYSILYGIIIFAGMVGGQFLIRAHPGFVIYEGSPNLNFIIGLSLLIIVVAVTLIMRRWFFALLPILLSAPELIARFVTDGASPTSENYLIISSISLFVCSIVIMSILLYTGKKGR